MSLLAFLVCLSTPLEAALTKYTCVPGELKWPLFFHENYSQQVTRIHLQKTNTRPLLLLLACISSHSQGGTLTLNNILCFPSDILS